MKNTKVITEFPNYKIGKDGIVYSKRKGWRNPVTKTWKTEENWKAIRPVLDKAIGYHIVTLIRYDNGIRIKKNQFIHRLLCKAFISNPENKAHVNHIDGNKINNNLSNLEWSTEKENSQHAVRTGLTTFTHSEKALKQYTKDGVFIRTFISAREAEKETGVAFQNISKVVNKLRKTAGGYYWELM